MKAKIAWAIASVLVFVFFLIIYLPASQITSRLALPEEVSLYGVSGTLWEGSAQQVVVNGLPVDNVSWEIHPAALLWGDIRVSLNGGNMRSPEAISFSGPLTTGLFSQTRVSAESFVAYIPVDRILAQVSLPLPVNAAGRFKLSLQTLDYNGQCNELNGQGSWLNAAVAGTQGPIDFGTYDASLSCADGNFIVNVEEPNKLGLSMQAQADPQFSDISVEGRFKPDNDLPKEVHQAARFFGQPDSNGYTEFSL
ncbi:type II secretion system protein N [Salinimonas chungwhensis]|uniref:type II secretion system protein N n=1 Tax=Salinimonas chungwhensis TaxID=265425 RepID=UPI00035D0F81|nr:type II secretion system protein N [Salinimonas chungwhensis]